MLIELLLNRIRRSCSGLAGRVAGQRQGGERHICDHQNNSNPRQYRADFLWYLFDPAGEQRVNSFQPYDRCDPPKKAVEQVDSSAKVERDVTVVPKGRAKQKLRKDAAQILIGSADDRAICKYIAVTFIFILIEKRCQKRTRQPPDDTERSVNDAAAAHPVAHRDPAEDRLYDISKERADQKEPDQLIQAASGGEAGRLRLLFLLLCRDQFFRTDIRIGLFQSLPDHPRDRIAKRVSHLLHAVRPRCHAVHMPPPFPYNSQRPGKICRKQNARYNQDDFSDKTRNKMHQT